MSIQLRLSLAQLGLLWLLCFISPREVTMNPFNEFQALCCVYIRFVLSNLDYTQTPLLEWTV